jgi:hypothetical protein
VEIRFEARKYQVDENGEYGIGDAGRTYTRISEGIRNWVIKSEQQRKKGST